MEYRSINEVALNRRDAESPDERAARLCALARVAGEQLLSMYEKDVKKTKKKRKKP